MMQLTKFTQWIGAVGAAVLLQACGGGGGGGPAAPVDQPVAAASCSIADQRQSLAQFMQDEYYWYRNLHAPDESAANMDQYFQSMLYRPTDRYSFTQSTSAYEQLFTEGRRTGYGYTLVWTDPTLLTLRVRSVEPLGPAARAGLQRGDTIVSIDGFAPQDIAAGRLPTVSTAGVPRTFSVVTAQGQAKQFSAVSEDFPLQQVVATNVFTVPGPTGTPTPVGYLAYQQFTDYSVDDVRAAFQRFAAAGIQEVILDLRYNGGGSVYASRDVASLIGGSATAGQVYATLRFNDKQSGQNQQVPFELPAATAGTALGKGLPRAFVITSGGTASASELVINGLRPFAKVVLVGDRTYGKPYGFVPRDYCGVTYEAVQFESVNALGVGGYDTGIAADCTVADDLDHQLGDPAERRIATALNYVTTGSCGATAQALRQTSATPPPIGDTAQPGMFLK